LPREGYKSITVPDDVYNYYRKFWEKDRERYRLQGVRSFSGFVSKLLNELIEIREREKETTRLA
jgi:predicted CopG family antitoxin